MITLRKWYKDPRLSTRTLTIPAEILATKLTAKEQALLQLRPSYKHIGPRLPIPEEDWAPPPVPEGYVDAEYVANLTPDLDLQPDIPPLTATDIRDKAHNTTERIHRAEAGPLEQDLPEDSYIGTDSIKDITPHMGPTRILLLFYGGRRREGDVADYAERCISSAKCTGIQMCVAVVDIVHGPHHDISRGAASFWIANFLQLRVAAFGAAPPCETWSLARWIEISKAINKAEEYHNRSHPVPLRHASQLWGRADLTPKEHRQLRTANVLLMFTIGFATLAAFIGVGVWIEHPGLLPQHHTLGAPSIWNLEQIQKLIALPYTQRRQVNHSDYAGTATKPTGIFAHRLFSLDTHLQNFRCPVVPRTVLKGKNRDTGEWLTAIAKEYPPPLSHALARTMVDAAVAPPTKLGVVLPENFIEDLQRYMPVLDPYADEDVAFGADFVDNAMLPIDRFKMPIHIGDLPISGIRYGSKGTNLPLYVNDSAALPHNLWP